jgi:hypothetical protein
VWQAFLALARSGIVSLPAPLSAHSVRNLARQQEKQAICSAQDDRSEICREVWPHPAMPVGAGCFCPLGPID